MDWEFPTHDDGVTCTKCYRKPQPTVSATCPSFDRKRQDCTVTYL